jgi:hypothetical protein
MNAGAERGVLLVRPVGIETRRFGEGEGIAIGAGEQ